MTTAAADTKKPTHIADASVYDFDIFHDAELLRDPHQRTLAVINEAPAMFWTPRNGGHWIALRYQDAFRVLREPETFSSALITPEQIKAMQSRAAPGSRRTPESKPVLLDPPEHTKYRAPLQPAFSPKAMMALKADIEVLAMQLIESIKDQGHCDFIPAVAEPFPVRVFLKMMGLSADKLKEFRALVREVFAPRGHDPGEQARRIRDVADAMLDVIHARRTDPKDDLISKLWSIEVDGQPMTLELMEDYCSLLFLAGLDTVINAIGFGMRHLAQHPELQAKLRAEPKLIPEASEEFLRRYTFTVPMRRVVRDTQLGGVSLKVGDVVIPYLPACDLDAAQFPEPESFEVQRENNVHMAFGAGPHRCLGSHLARIELQAIYRIALERLPTFRLDPDAAPQFHAGNLLAVASLPLRWD